MTLRISCAFAPCADTPEHVRAAEQLGYERAWVYDSPALYHDVFIALARSADRTTTIGLGTGVMIPSLRHPMAAAASIASLAELAPDRVAIGIGTGFSGRAALGQPALRWGFVEDWVRTVQALLRGQKAAVPAAVRHLAVHAGHLVEVTESDRPYLTPELITSFTITGSASGVRERIAARRDEGVTEVGADDLMVPNGVAIADDGKSLVVAESAGAQLSRYSVRDGLLSDRSVVPLTPAPDMPFVAPDGICLDAEGGIWAADPLAHRVVHLREDAIDREIPVEDHPLACVLGGEDRRTLFICANEVWSKHDRRDVPTGSVVSVRVDVPGAGRP